MDTNSRSLISFLLVRYLDGHTTPAQEEQLFALVEAHAGEEALNELLAEQFAVTEPSPEYVREDWQPVIDRILYHKEATQPTVIPFYRRWTIIAAAAVLILVAGTYFILNQNRKPDTQNIVQTQAQRFKNDVAPGKPGAILKLSNGKEILLDTMGNGTVTTGFTKDVNTLSVTAAAVEYATVTTPKARTQTVVLADGTQVWLNAGSSITFPTAFNGNKREVNITGEVYFEVAKNAAKPFIAQTTTDRIEVLGTHFNINAYATVKTTLLEGKVKIGNTILRPGEQYNNGKISEADTEEVMAWKNGMFRFNGTGLTEIMAQVERWYDVDIKYEGSFANIHFTGGVERSANASVLLKKLELTDGVEFTIEGRMITVRKK
ncbi:MAG: FecR domain-containing protein [Sediminibacterium sp.]